MDYIVESEVLYCNEGTSDKIYELYLEAEGRNYVVHGRYGRRDSILKPVEKFRGASLRAATEEYNKVLREKLNKGYKRKAIPRVNPRIITATTEARRELADRGLINHGVGWEDSHEHQAKVKKAKKPSKAKKPAPEEPTDQRNITLGDL